MRSTIGGLPIVQVHYGDGLTYTFLWPRAQPPIVGTKAWDDRNRKVVEVVGYGDGGYTGNLRPLAVKPPVAPWKAILAFFTVGLSLPFTGLRYR